MKSFLFLMTLLSLPLTWAQEMTLLKDGDHSLTQADAQIISIREICPISGSGIRCRALGSLVTIQVTLKGCLDNFGGYYSTFEEGVDKGKLHFAAINVFNQGSEVTHCVEMPTRKVIVHVPSEDEIELVQMKFNGSNSAPSSDRDTQL